MIKHFIKLAFRLSVYGLLGYGVMTMYNIDFPDSPSPVAMLSTAHIPPQQSYDCWVNNCMQTQP